MTFSDHTAAEIHLLSQFNLESTSTGIKVHSHDASSDAIAAASSLFDKGLTTQIDGGYLTERGIEAATHAQCLLRLLTI